jgi:hypothetical protein
MRGKWTSVGKHVQIPTFLLLFSNPHCSRQYQKTTRPKTTFSPKAIPIQHIVTFLSPNTTFPSFLLVSLAYMHKDKTPCPPTIHHPNSPNPMIPYSPLPNPLLTQSPPTSPPTINKPHSNHRHSNQSSIASRTHTNKPSSKQYPPTTPTKYPSIASS